MIGLEVSRAPRDLRGGLAGPSQLCSGGRRQWSRRCGGPAVRGGLTDGTGSARAANSAWRPKWRVILLRGYLFVCRRHRIDSKDAAWEWLGANSLARAFTPKFAWWSKARPGDTGDRSAGEDAETMAYQACVAWGDIVSHVVRQKMDLPAAQAYAAAAVEERYEDLVASGGAHCRRALLLTRTQASKRAKSSEEVSKGAKPGTGATATISENDFGGSPGGVRIFFRIFRPGGYGFSATDFLYFLGQKFPISAVNPTQKKSVKNTAPGSDRIFLG